MALALTGRTTDPPAGIRGAGLACGSTSATPCSRVGKFLDTQRRIRSMSGEVSVRATAASCVEARFRQRHGQALIPPRRNIRPHPASPALVFSPQKKSGRGSFLEGTCSLRGCPHGPLVFAASPSSSRAELPGSRELSFAHGEGIPCAALDNNPQTVPHPQTDRLDSDPRVASHTTPRRAVLLSPLALTAAAGVAVLGGATAPGAVASEGLQQRGQEPAPIRKLKDNFGVAVLLATEESLIDTGKISRYDLQKEFFKLRQQEFAPLKKANFGGLRSLGQDLNVNDVPYFNFQSYIQWKLVSKKLRTDEERKEFNLAVGRRLLQRYLPDVATQALSTCPNYQVASNSQRPSSPSSYTVASTDQRLPVGDPNQGLQAAALESDGSTFPIPSAQQPALDRSNTHSSSPLASSLAQNTPLSMTLPYTSQEPGSAQNGQPSNISSSLSEAYREPGAPAVSAGSSGVPSAYQGQGGRPVRFVGMGGVPMEDQVVDGVWRGALGEEEERRTGVCAKGVMSAVSALLEKLKAISFVEDFTVKWSDVADGVPEAGKRGSATLFVKLKVRAFWTDGLSPIPKASLHKNDGPADLQGGVLIRAEEDNFWQRITSSMLSALFEELGVDTAVDEYFYREMYKPKSLLEQAVLALGDPLLPVIDVDVDEIDETWRLSWA